MKSKLRLYILTVGLPLILSTPFLISDAKLFLERTQIYISDPEAIANNLAPTDISLNMAAVILKYTHIVLPTSIVVLIGIVVAAAVVLFGIKKPAYGVLSTFLVFSVLFMFGPFVFIHYWAFLGNLLLLVLLLFLASANVAVKPR